MSRKHHDCCCDMCCNEMPYPYEYSYSPYATSPVAEYNNYSNGACGWNIWTIILALIILQCSGILCNNRAFVLLLLFWFCGGGFGGGCGFNNPVATAPVAAAPVAMPCCC